MIWEEREGGFQSLACAPRGADGGVPSATTAGGSAGEGTTTSSRWANKATLSDARRAVNAVAFAPRHLGLRLASGSADGVVRIYEALDTMNLNHWKLEAEVGDGADDHEGGQASSNENLGVTALSWCTGRFEPESLAVGLSSGRVSIYRYSAAQRAWLEAIRLPGHATSDGVPRGVLDVAWAPNIGRSYHLIATCGKDNRLKVHRVARGRGGKEDSEDNESQPSLAYEKTDVLDQSVAWRCQWNVTGTVLASSGDGGIVKLWKSDFQGCWKCVSEIVGDTAGVAAAAAFKNQ